MDRIFVVSTRSNEPSLIVFNIVDAAKHSAQVFHIGLRIVDTESGYDLQPTSEEIGLRELYDLLQTDNRISCYNLERKSSKNQILKRLAGSCLYNQFPSKYSLWDTFLSLFNNQGDVTEFFTYTSDWMWLISCNKHQNKTGGEHGIN